MKEIKTILIDIGEEVFDITVNGKQVFICHFGDNDPLESVADCFSDREVIEQIRAWEKVNQNTL